MDSTFDWKAYLDTDEKVLWEGRPTTDLFLFRPIELFLIPFSIFWFFFVFDGMEVSFTSGFLFNVAIILLLAAGIYFTIGRFLVDWYYRQKTLYAVTDKRALIVTTAFGRRLRELRITPTLPLEFKDAPRGSVWLGDRSGRSSRPKLIEIWHGDEGGFTFREIETPRDVYRLIQQIKRGDA
ncbi:MAG: hypothetical protein AAFT19_06170 [Pseudomonadota bacterium]